ncbi:MAG: BrnA antitoxin family protein [Pseudomonadota bacterium]
MSKKYSKALPPKEIAAMSDTDIDYSDIPELDEDIWKKAKVVEPRAKKAVTIRYDHDVLEWFKAQGKGYQTRMNAVLRAYIEAQQKEVR